MSDEPQDLLKRHLNDESLILFNVDQVAVIYGKGSRWVRGQVASGHMPYVRIGRSLRFTEQNVRDYIASSTRRTEAPPDPWGRKRRTRKGG